MRSFYLYQTSLGKMWIAADENAIYRISFFEIWDAVEKETPAIREAYNQICDYLHGERKTFDLLLDPQGTPFQKSVWDELMKIPYGEVRSYKQIAEAVGNPKACRAVGMANNKNPLLIVVPCHRVIGSNGALVGYGGGLNNKNYLLKLEKEHS